MGGRVKPRGLMINTVFKFIFFFLKRAAELDFHCCSSISFVFKVCLLSAAALSRPAQGAVCHSPRDGGLGSGSSSAEAAPPPEEANCPGQVRL